MRVTKFPKIDIKPPDQKFWYRVATQLAKDIRTRTEKGGKDAQGKAFRPYSRGYEAYRREKGRSSRVSLSFTGKMLGALARGVSATKDRARVTLSGREGGKAWFQELQGRVFMGISRKDANNIIKSVATWTARKNKLK